MLCYPFTFHLSPFTFHRRISAAGAASYIPPPPAAISNLVSLMELLQPEVHVLHDYLGEVESLTGLKLPLTDEDFEADFVEKDWVKKTRAVYAVC